MNHKNPAEMVDPLIDSANRRFIFFTTASRPFGMVNLSPDTSVGQGPWKSGYKYGDEHIRWFSHVHAWQLCGIPVMPAMGPLRGHMGSEAYKSGFSHREETAKAGYYRVNLIDHGIFAELTSTVRTGFHRYTFNRTGEAWIIFDLGAEIMHRMSDCLVRLPDGAALEGYVENERTERRKKRLKIFYRAEFSRPFESAACWQNGRAPEKLTGAAAGPGIGAAFKFGVKKGEKILLKLSISYCGPAQAKLNMETELPHWDFDRVKRDSFDEWNSWLGRIEVEGGTSALKTKFYTDLFHALKGRRRVSDVDGKYMDMTGDLPAVRQIPLDENKHPLYEHHNSDSFWGAAWSINTLWPMAWPEVTGNFCNTLLDMYRNGGLIPRGPSGGDYTFVMSGPSSTTLLVSAWMNNIRNFDINTAYEGLKKNHMPGGMMDRGRYEYYTSGGGGCEDYIKLGYVPQGKKTSSGYITESGALTLEYAFHDWALAQLAKRLGKKEDYIYLLKRAGNYKNIWHPGIKYFVPRTQDGSFIDFDPMSPAGWEEGNAEQYRWHVPHDPAGLIKLFGSREAFLSQLDGLFSSAERTGFTAPHGRHHESPLDYGNQPSTYIAHLFNYAGAPWLTQKWVRKIMETAKSGITPYGGYGGDEDQGMMGSLNVLMAMGLFSVQGGCSAEPFYEISSPVFDRITIRRRAAGRDFVIETENSGDRNIYIQSAELNGRKLEKPWFRNSCFNKGGTLKITLGPEPNKRWGSRAEDAPPSMSDAP